MRHACGSGSNYRLGMPDRSCGSESDYIPYLPLLGMMPILVKAVPIIILNFGRFSSPRAARELSLLILYASCLEGSDPVRLFEKRVNAKREKEVLSAPPKLVYSKHVLRYSERLLEAVLERWDHHVQVMDKVTPASWKNQPGRRILELCILHIAMAEIAMLGTRHQIVLNESVDLAKRFCDGSAPRFINGCLRTFVKEHMGKQPTSQCELLIC
ncbi:uncharacterized protein LOC116257106 [Nymphaea colorata]|nr:uncharacterized protein LOC116257106 [Nymphaea colorata]